MVPHPLFFTHKFMEFAYFCLFPSIFRLKWYPILVINSSMERMKSKHLLFFRPHVYGFFTIFHLYSAHFPPIFRLTFSPYSASPVLLGSWQLFYVVRFAIKNYKLTHKKIDFVQLGIFRLSLQSSVWHRNMCLLLFLFAWLISVCFHFLKSTQIWAKVVQLMHYLPSWLV